MNLITENIKMKAVNLDEQKIKLISMETWTYEWAVRNLIAQLLMPPGIWLWLILLPLFLLKKRELLQKSLIVVGVVMIWLSSTNYLAIQLTNALGSVITWLAPLDFKVFKNKCKLNQGAKQNDETNSSKPGEEQAIVILGGWRSSGANEYPQYQDLNIEARPMEKVIYGRTLSQAMN